MKKLKFNMTDMTGPFNKVGFRASLRSLRDHFNVTF